MALGAAGCTAAVWAVDTAGDSANPTGIHAASAAKRTRKREG
jgi:hypothetical protein